MSKLKLIASYLPQFHPIPENDLWHGKGFTEWFNVGKSKPLFKGHYQPRVPTELGYYDLRLSEVRAEQAKLASEHGISGFCYWHYWFGNGKQLLNRPMEEIVKSGEPNFPFCLGWANETWQGIDHGVKSRVLIEQEYPGEKDYIDHFYKMLPAFKDTRYIKHNNKIIFLIYRPFEIPKFSEFKLLWNNLANENNISEFLFIAQINNSKDFDRALKIGFDMVNVVRIRDVEIVEHGNIYSKLRWRIGFKRIYEYKYAIKYLLGEIEKSELCIPTIVPNWDHSPRSGSKALIYHNSTPEYFEEHLSNVFQLVKSKNFEDQIVFIKSWNEWGEGNYLEPDLKFGRSYLEKLKSTLEKFNLI
jgi:lipopolysaccharide biosynthesis protein